MSGRRMAAAVGTAAALGIGMLTLAGAGQAPIARVAGTAIESVVAIPPTPHPSPGGGHHHHNADQTPVASPGSVVETV